MISPSSTAVPAKTSSPSRRSTASGSPVRADWFTIASAPSTSPSSGVKVRFPMTVPSSIGARRLCVYSIVRFSSNFFRYSSRSPSKMRTV